jgi:hypothetical protein
MAGIATWFLHCYQPSIVVTTAPSTNQVIKQLWGEIRSQSREMRSNLLPGLMPSKAEWKVDDKWYAQGICTDKQERFRGDHGPNMLFIFDEANGIPEWMWEEAENMCTAKNNKILAVGNPVDPSGPFFDTFNPKRGSQWTNIDISSLDHPNIVYGREIYPGAATRKWAQGRIDKLCERIEACDAVPPLDFEFPRQSGKWYRSSPVFQARILGIFPNDGPDTLIPLSAVIHARTREPMMIDDTSPVDIGLDVAYQGGDACVMFARRGQCVIHREKWYGRDPAQTKAKAANLIKRLTEQGFRVGTVAVDAIGIGSGVAYELIGMLDEGFIKCDRVIAVQVSEKANNSDKYTDKRAELAFALAERFRVSEIDLTRLKDEADDFEDQAPQLKRKLQISTGREGVETKDDIRKRLKYSPDDFDAMVLCFLDTADFFADSYVAMCSAE